LTRNIKEFLHIFCNQSD